MENKQFNVCAKVKFCKSNVFYNNDSYKFYDWSSFKTTVTVVDGSQLSGDRLAPLQYECQYYEADYTDSNLFNLVYSVVSAKLTTVPDIDGVLIDIQLQLIRQYLSLKRGLLQYEHS